MHRRFIALLALLLLAVSLGARSAAAQGTSRCFAETG